MKEIVLPLGPGRSVALPGKTRRMTAPSIALVFNPEVELVDSASACELRPLPGLTVQNEPALRRAHHATP